MEQRNGISGSVRRAGMLGAGTMAFGLLLVSPAVVKAQDRTSAAREAAIHIVGLDSAQTASLRACRRLQAYGRQVAVNKLKALRETGTLAKTVDSVMAAIQRTGQYKETVISFVNLATLPDSVQSLTTTAGPACSPVPAQAALQQLVQAELRRLPRMGVGLVPLNRQSAAAAGHSDTLGLLVQSVAPNLGAKAAGIVVGDAILSINDKPVHSIAQFRELAASWKDGDKVNVEVIRKGGTRQKISVELLVRP